MTRAAEVVWYVTGRFYSTIPPANEKAKLFDVGYFLHLQGIDAPLFDGDVMSESTALLTFAAKPFTSKSVTNGGLEIGIDMRGTFELYVREQPGASFDDPHSFAQGRCIATFERVAIVPTVNIGIASGQTFLSNVFSARLIETSPFELGGREYDLRDIVGYGVTQWGTAVTEAITPPAGYSAAVPFAGAAIRV